MPLTASVDLEGMITHLALETAREGDEWFTLVERDTRKSHLVVMVVLRTNKNEIEGRRGGGAECNHHLEVDFIAGVWGRLLDYFSPRNRYPC